MITRRDCLLAGAALLPAAAAAEVPMGAAALAPIADPRFVASGYRLSQQLRFPAYLPLAAGTWTNTTAGSDSGGTYALAGAAADSASDQFAVTSGALHYAKIRMGGTQIQNQVTVNFFNGSGAYLSNQVVYIFSAFGFSVTVSPARDWVISFTAPAGAATANFNLPLIAGRSLRIYGRLAIPASTMPFAPIVPTPIPYKGISYQKLGSNLMWMGDATVTLTQVQSFLATAVAAGARGIRLFGGLDSGMNFDGSGVFTSFKPACLTNLGYVATAAQTMGLAVVLCVFTPLQFTGSTSDLNRAVMTSAPILAGYQAACTQLAAFANAFPAIVAFDIANEPHFQMAANADGSGSYSADQINTALTAFSAGLRAGSSKPLILSAADGPSAITCFAGTDPAIYDIADYHCYGGLLRAYQPQVLKPLVCLELGPNVSTTGNQQIADEALPILYAVPGSASAAYWWIDFLNGSPLLAAETKAF